MENTDKPDLSRIQEALTAHQRAISTVPLRSLSQHPERFKDFSLKACDLLFDFSKQPINQETLTLLTQLAKAAEVEKARDALFAGECVNRSENRQALHPALRHPRSTAFPSKTQDVMPDIEKTFSQLKNTAKALREGSLNSITQDRFTDILHIGIGGSSTGTALLYDVLRHTQHHRIRLHFVETLDLTQLHDTLKHCDPKTTAIVIVSKTFSTAETLHNAASAIEWLSLALTAYQKEDLIKTHCFAVTNNTKTAVEWGLSSQHVFPLPDWAGGRYSVWSAVSFSLIASVGIDHFQDFLDGAYAMDQHFLTTALEKNIPVIHALLRLWLGKFFHYPYYAVLPYAHDLRQLPLYLQQLDLESNGKSVRQDGTALTETTAPLLWGTAQTQGQHSVHQWLQQGTSVCPVDFIACAHFEINENAQKTAALLFSQCISQSLTLMKGKTAEECVLALIQKGVDKTQAKKLSPHQMLAGNRPSNTVVLSTLNAKTLGSLLALYEHSTFVQAVIWQINPFDQWGVEEGKCLAIAAYEALRKHSDINEATTQSLIDFFWDCQRS